MRLAGKVVLLCLAAIFWMACGEDKKKKKGAGIITLKEAPMPSQLQIPSLLELDGNKLLQGDYNRTSAVNITSLKIPIYEINVFHAGGGIPIYTCPSATPSECMVELNGTALQDLLKTSANQIEFPDENMDTLTIQGIQVRYSPSIGGGDPGWNVSVTASAELGGITYYTTEKLGMSTTGPAVAWQVSGVAAGGSEINLPTPFTLTEGGTIDVNLFMDIAHVVNLDLANIAGVCGADSSGCFQFSGSPEIIAAVDTEVITSEHYVISLVDKSEYPGTGCLGFLGLYVDSDGTPIGGYMRNYFYPDQKCNRSTIVGGQMRDLAVNADGAISFRIAGLDYENPWYTYSSFKRETHEGTFTGNADRLDETDLKGEQKYKSEKL